MRPDALDLICCPACGGVLTLCARESNSGEVIAGDLQCACGRRYPIERRMPRLYVDDENWMSKAREAEGWVKLHQKLGIYDQTGVDIDFRVPYFEHEMWATVVRHFEAGLKLAELTGGETVLDLGAGRGWAAKQFALTGCRVAAIDVVADEQIGLGRAWAIMEQAGVHFEPIIGDSENLPFRPGTFDLVFGAAVLHHTSDLPKLLASVYRVLKPGGRLIAVNEPCIRLSDDPQQMLHGAEELVFGINENRPNFFEYWSALRGAGFGQVEIFPIDAYGQSEGAVAAWAAELGAIAPPLRDWRLRKLPHILVSAVRRGWNLKGYRGRLPAPESRYAALIQSILIHVVTGIVLRARREA